MINLNKFKFIKIVCPKNLKILRKGVEEMEKNDSSK